MSEVISLSTFHNHNLTDQDHALFMQTVTSQSGLFYGCEVTLKDENTLHISTGEGIACGRIFRIMDMDYPVELSASGDLLGRLYVHIDTALDDTPAQLMDVQGSTLPALIQEDDMNQSTGVYEIELATFSINELGISNLEFTAPKATGGGAGGKSIAPDYVATESYEKGRIFFQNGTLYRTIAAIPAGAPLVLDTNVVETSIAAEIEALNQNLTTRVPLYNDQDDWWYVNGKKYKKAFLQSLVYFNADLGYNVDDFGVIDESQSNNYYFPVNSHSTTIAENNITYAGSASWGNNGGAQTAWVKFINHEYVDITQYRKMNVKGLYVGRHYQNYWYTTLRIYLIDENGTATPALYSKTATEAGAYGTSSDAIETEIDLTQYSGNYKLQITLEWYGNSVNATGLSQNFQLNELYLS